MSIKSKLPKLQTTTIASNEETISEKGSTSKSQKSIKTLPKIKNDSAPVTPTVYKYKILPGNNSRVVLTALHKRSWWHPYQNNIGIDDVETEDPNIPAPTFVWEMHRNPKRYKNRSYALTMLNHIQRNNCLVSKKGLYLSLRNYCTANRIDLDSVIPRTFYIAPSTETLKVSDDLQAFLNFNKSRRFQSFPSSRTKLSTSVATETSTSIPTSSTSSSTLASTSSFEESVIWILKPASKTNRGYGIKVVRGLSEVLAAIKSNASDSPSKKSTSGVSRLKGVAGVVVGRGGKMNNSEGLRSFHGTKASTISVSIPEAESLPEHNPELSKQAKQIAITDGWIVQEYIERPLLVSGRKFDIRCYVLLTNFGSKHEMRAYFFRDAYVRTSCKPYSLTNISDRETHLTNDAVQKYSKNYGKFESGNKLSLNEWQESINADYPGTRPDMVHAVIMPEIRRLCSMSVAAACPEMQPSDITKSFELLGYDFMITGDFRPLLIEINSNPCLEFACPLLENLISSLIENVLRITVDQHFPPLKGACRSSSVEEIWMNLQSEESKFDLIYSFPDTTVPTTTSTSSSTTTSGPSPPPSLELPPKKGTLTDLPRPRSISPPPPYTSLDESISTVPSRSSASFISPSYISFETDSSNKIKI